MKWNSTIVALLLASILASEALADRGRGGRHGRDDDSPGTSPTPTASATPSASPTASPRPSATPRPNDDNRPGHGGNHGGAASSDKVELRSRLAPASGSTARGKMDYRSKNSETRLQVNVKVPLPSTLPALADRAAAESALLEIGFARAGTEYAVCSFSIDDDSDGAENPLRPEFKVDIKLKRTNLRLKKGACDTDLAIDGIQSGIPSPVEGDTIAVRIEGETAFLTGTVQQK